MAYAVLNAAELRRAATAKATGAGGLTVWASGRAGANPHKGPGNWVTVRQAVGRLKKLKDGRASQRKSNPLHIASALSDLNRARCPRPASPGGTWRDWPERQTGGSLPSTRESQARFFRCIWPHMEWDKPAPTMTTLCNGYGNGRFGHPEQRRGISLREAAIFQSFPETYRFTREGEGVVIKTVGRLIGNAVPPKLGEAVARALYAALPAVAGTATVAAGRAR